MMRWILIIVLIIVALFAWRSCRDADTGTVTGDVNATADSLMDRTGDMASDAANSVKDAMAKLGAFVERKLPDGSTLRVPEHGVESKVIAFIDNKSARVSDTLWFNFDRLTFETGVATLTSESNEQLDNIANMLKAYPNVNIKIGGYTDNTGDASVNKNLSEDRANAVKQGLIDRGIAANRLQAEGYGDAHPVADNSTEDGRAQNRRIALRVTKK